MVTFVGDAQFLGDFFVVASKDGQFLFDLGLGGGNVDIDGGQFVDAAYSFLVLLFGSSLSTEGLKNHMYM